MHQETAPSAAPGRASLAPASNNWKVRRKIEVEIEVSAADAGTPAEAVSYAAELCRDLALHVSIGGVPLPACFIPE